MVNKGLILLEEEITNREQALEVMIQKANELGYLQDKEIYKAEVIAREEMMPTSVGFKVAIPHGRSKSVSNPFVVFLRNKKEFIWDDRNENEVDLIFMIGVPEANENNLHLRFLAEISKKLMNDDFRENLRKANNKEEVYEMLHDINEKVISNN
ncbi:MAG: PTS sugar transporter subunit IIA [Anaerorhabdus sp.]|uniref:PTS sugar transporter subunit IIA n=1 Tax=Anaerorhabdus sp. TaxID=1872524 RepID=UPI003A855807